MLKNKLDKNPIISDLKQQTDIISNVYINRYEKETRSIKDLSVHLDNSTMLLKIEINFNNDSCRQLKTTLNPDEKGIDLAEDLLVNSLIGEEDINFMAMRLQECINNTSFDSGR